MRQKLAITVTNARAGAIRNRCAAKGKESRSPGDDS